MAGLVEVRPCWRYVSISGSVLRAMFEAIDEGPVPKISVGLQHR